MRKVLLILFTALIQPIQSQVYSFESFTEDEGLSQSFIYDINQDSRGFLYVGTGDGLSTYGGSRFMVFNSLNGLADNFVTTIYRDSKNRMWAGHFEGSVSVLHNDGKIEKIKQSADNSKITQIIEIMPDTYVFVKNITGIALYNYQTKKYLNIEEEVFTGLLNILVKKDELLLLKQEGIYSIKINELLKKNYKITKLKSLKEPVFMEYNMTKDKIIVVDNYTGILSFNTNYDLSPIDTFKIEKKESCSFTKPFIDRFNNIYIGTSESGFFKIDQAEKSVRNYSVKNGLKTNSIQSVFVDREDNLWIGTFGKGLQQLNNELYSYNFTFDDERHIVSVNSILKHNNKFITATNNGIGYISDNIVSHLNHPKLTNKSFNHIIYHSGAFIFSSEEGKLFKSDTLFKDIKEINFGISNRKILINSLCSNNTHLFICSTAGLIIYNIKDQSFKLLNTENGLLHNNVKFAFEDSKRRLWICSPGSPVYYLDANYEQIVFKEVPGMRNFNINSVCEDKNNNIWISTIGDGIFKFNGKVFENYNVASGLKSNYCYGIKADGKSGIWVNHINGISYKNSNKKNFNRIGNNTELMQFNFIENSSYYDNVTSEIILGASEGIVKINTSKQHYNEAEPKLNLLYISINDKSVSSFSDTLILKYGSYDIDINFIGICLTEPNKVNYKYILEGHDDEWQFATYETKKINFSKLKDGEYTFIIYAANNDGLWTSNPVKFKFIIKKPFWKGYLFYILLVLCLIVLFVFLVKRRTQNLLRKQKILQGIIAQKTIEISNEKELIAKVNENLQIVLKDLKDSINYAKKIQSYILPDLSNVQKNLKTFLYFQPKDVVSGDYYGFYNVSKDKTIIFLIDCTGHGVPGAFLTVISKAFLNKIIIDKEIYEPDTIIENLNLELRSFFDTQASEENKNFEGLVMSICAIDYPSKTVSYCGAGRPILYKIENELVLQRGNIHSVGYDEDLPSLEVIKIPFDKGLRIYLHSDGIQDQFGGPNLKKFSSKRIVDALEKHQDLPFDEECEYVITEFLLWKDVAPQVDDICFFAFELFSGS